MQKSCSRNIFAPEKLTERAPKPIFSKMEGIAAHCFVIGYLLFEKQPKTNNRQQEIPRALAGG